MLTVTVVNDPAVLAEREAEWWSLLSRSETDEPTLSPDWLLTWWRVFGKDSDRKLNVLLFQQGGRLVGMLPLLLRRTRDAFGSLRRLELLASGEAERDEICSDFIGLLVERGAEQAAARTTFATLLDGAGGQRWDELVLEAMNGGSTLPLLLAGEVERLGLLHTLEVAGGAPYIALPSRWDDYLEALPGSSRYAVRRSLRDLDKWAHGNLQFRTAQNDDELARGLDVLKELHAERWAAEGRPGVFASTKFTEFHQEIMPRLLARKALQLSWLVARRQPVAVVYNLVWNNKVYYYQSGRAVHLPPNLRPGMALHAYSIREAIESGRREYDFLGGLARYKLQLAPSVRPLVRLRIWSPSFRGAVRGTVEVIGRQLRDASRPWLARGDLRRRLELEAA